MAQAQPGSERTRSSSCRTGDSSRSGIWDINSRAIVCAMFLPTLSKRDPPEIWTRVAQRKLGDRHLPRSSRHGSALTELCRRSASQFFVLWSAALFSNRQRCAEYACGHVGSACAGKWRNIDSDAAAIRGSQISAEARVQVPAAIHCHPAGAYGAAKKPGPEKKCGWAGRGDRQI